MKNRNPFAAFVCAVFFAQCLPALAAPFTLVPGDVYGVIQGGIRQFDSSLNTVSSLILPGATVTEGVAFTPSGHLIFSAFQNGTQHVIEVGPNGSILHNLDLNIGSLDRASHIDVDSQGRIYVVTTPNVIEISPDFSSQHMLPANFTRASGVAIGPGDVLYVTDQAANRLVEFNTARNVIATFQNFGATPTGLDFDANGHLFATLFSTRQLVMVDPTTGQRTTILSNLDGASDIDFAADGSYYLSIESGGILQHRSAAGTLLKEIGTGSFMDSLAVMPLAAAPTVPLPPAVAIGSICSLLLMAAVGFRRPHKQH